jgi:hypothetical protein
MNDLEIRTELRDNAVNKLRNLMQKWEDRITPDNLRLGERYVKNEIDLIVHFAFTGCSGHANDFIAVFQNAKFGPGRPRNEVIEKTSVSPRIGSGPIGNRDGMLYGRTYEEVMVLVNNVKVMDKPKETVPGLPTLVRFGCPDEFYGVRMDALYFTRKVGFATGRALCKGELMALLRLPTVNLNKLPDQMVQGGSKVMYGVADDTGNIVQVMPKHFDPEDFVSRLRILIHNETISVGIAEGGLNSFKITDVAFGPFDFRPDAS